MACQDVHVHEPQSWSWIHLFDFHDWTSWRCWMENAVTYCLMRHYNQSNEFWPTTLFNGQCWICGANNYQNSRSVLATQFFIMFFAYVLTCSAIICDVYPDVLYGVSNPVVDQLSSDFVWSLQWTGLTYSIHLCCRGYMTFWFCD
jgi:hypothetical protein